MDTITQPIPLEAWHTLLAQRFGADPSGWAFVCPACKDIATGAEFAAALADHPRERNGKPITFHDVLGQECIGRTLGALTMPTERWQGRGCDWVAYGLLPGPIAVEFPDGNIGRAFAPAPEAEATS